jgi:hypothetical protein
MEKTFFCKTHLQDLPISERSPDARYCQSCYDFLLKEASMLSPGKVPEWTPSPSRYPVSDAVRQTTDSGKVVDSTVMGVENTKTKMSQAKLAIKYRKRELPLEHIKQMSDEGINTRNIAARLQVEGINVSYKTVQRILNGMRNG